MSLLFLPISCDKDKQEQVPALSYESRIEAFQYELVQLEFTPNSFTTSSYTGNINGQALELHTLSDSVLVFNVGGLDPGIYDLEIDELHGAVVELTVLETILQNKQNILIEGLVNKINLINESIVDESLSLQMQNASDNIILLFANATPEEQFEMAAYYQANAELFDSMLNLDPDSNPNGRITTDLKVTMELSEYLLSVLAMGAGSVVAKFGPTPDTKAIGVGVAIAGLVLAIKNYKDFISISFIVAETTIDKLVKELNNGRQLQNAQFEIDKSYLMGISGVKRNVKAEDKDLAFLVEFFSANETMNSMISGVNEAINFINAQITFLSFDNINPLPEPSGANTETFIIDESNFNNYSFEIGDNRISVSTSLDSDGNVAISLSAGNEVDFTSAVSTELIISYKDTFSEKSTSYPILVLKVSPLVGTWHVNEWFAYFNQWTTSSSTSSCPNHPLVISQLREGFSYTFDNTNYQVAGVIDHIEKAVVITNGECQYTGEESSSQGNINYSRSYSINDNQFFENGQPVAEILIMTENHLRLSYYGYDNPILDLVR